MTCDTSHGWVKPRADGARAKCGGPNLCSTCETEKMHNIMLTACFGPPVGTPTDGAPTRDAAVGAAIGRACAELPFGYSIELFLEAGYGGARLLGPEGGEIDLDQDERDLAYEINAGIDAAIATEQGKGAA
ncbi:hypothetical protein [Achromobacter sp. Bel]|uniref:hypothetical protein n=1 Tax=Achromobacter sp. Bel TaxID=2727415 RepID=UPI00145D68E3|nr:hypothetical protein [Achromobacter sp. Bel]NMK45550.1 hypothetical protein [Achromobacter sp. Bel]